MTDKTPDPCGSVSSTELGYLPGHGQIGAQQVSATSYLDVMLWPDGTWYFREDLHEYGHMSDDYEVMPEGSEKAEAFLAQEYAP